MSIPASRLLGRTALVATLLLASASLADAQSVTVRGKVASVGTVFILDCTPCQLTSGNINLNALIGFQIEATGNVTGTNIVDIDSSILVNDFLEITGSSQLGGIMKIQVHGPSGRVEGIHIALGNAFKVVKHMGWFLDFATSQQVWQLPIPINGLLEISGTIPTDPIFDGLDVFVQDSRFDLGQPGKLGNADCTTLHV